LKSCAISFPLLVIIYVGIKNEALSSSEDDDNTSFEKLGLLTEALLELGYAATGIKNFLLARVERVASAAHVGVNCAALLSAASGKCVSATAANCSFHVLWVNSSLHDLLLIHTVIGS
jgi:hypothetical protein